MTQPHFLPRPLKHRAVFVAGIACLVLVLTVKHKEFYGEATLPFYAQGLALSLISLVLIPEGL